MKKRFALWQLLLSIFLTVAAVLLLVCGAAWIFLGSSGLSLLESVALVHTVFVGEYDDEDSADSALSGYVTGLGDRWSHYLNAESYAEVKENRANQYGGIGVTVSYSDERGLLIVDVTQGGGGDQAGLQTGEIITSVDGQDVSGDARTDAADLIKGEAGTSVVLTVLDETGESREVTVVRARITKKSVSAELLDDNIALITVLNFYSGSAGQMKTAVEDLSALGCEAIIFDMRDNPGGYVSELTDILDYLMPEGVIFQDASKNGKTTKVTSDAACVDLPIAVLVNGDTYSAAEFFAAELQEEGRAIVVGSETTGKGYSQETFELLNGGALMISTGEYCTGNGRSLIGTGVDLDIAVDLSDEKAELLSSRRLDAEDDDQLQAAIRALS